MDAQAGRLPANPRNPHIEYPLGEKGSVDGGSMGFGNWNRVTFTSIRSTADPICNEPIPFSDDTLTDGNLKFGGRAEKNTHIAE